MTMFDTVMALAAQTTLSPGETCPSHETTAKFVRPIFIDSGVMHVIGHVVSRGRTDFGECIGVIGGVRTKLHVFCFDLPPSGACFIKAYPAETTEAFLDGHVSAFTFFGGVPISILYDNLKIAVARILGEGKRQRTRAFTELVSHYLFQERFGRPGKGI